MREISIPSRGTQLAVWHFAPVEGAGGGGKAPCIVLAQGLGGTRDQALDKFAARFAEAGFHALVFDYRHWGQSGGEPRQLLSIRRQLQDWASVIRFARCMAGVDPARIALWGTSLSGGHVLIAAARDGRIAAVSAQAPMVDGQAASIKMVEECGPGVLMSLAAHGTRDAMGALVGQRPHMVPIVGPPGTVAAMTTPDAEPGVYAMSPGPVRNEMAARFFLRIGFYQPRLHARFVKCPLLLQICDKDLVVSIKAVEKVAKQAPNVEVRHYPLGHFDVYVDGGFEQVVKDQVAFFDRVLKPARKTAQNMPWDESTIHRH